MQIKDRVRIVQGSFDGVQPRLIGLEGEVTFVYPPSQNPNLPRAEVVFADGIERTFFEDEMQLVWPAKQ